MEHEPFFDMNFSVENRSRVTGYSADSRNGSRIGHPLIIPGENVELINGMTAEVS
jgi:hypothetical protein